MTEENNYLKEHIESITNKDRERKADNRSHHEDSMVLTSDNIFTNNYIKEHSHSHSSKNFKPEETGDHMYSGGNKTKQDNSKLLVES